MLNGPKRKSLPLLIIIIQFIIFSLFINATFAASGSAILCPSGETVSPTVTFSTSNTLSSNVCADNVVVDSGVTVKTNGYAIYALDELTNYGIIENRSGGAGGSGTTNGTNGLITSALTSKYSGGAGGDSNYQSFKIILTFAWGSGGAGGGGANAAGGQRQSTQNGGNAGGSYGGGGGGGAAVAGCHLGSPCGNGGTGGGYVRIYANKFINKGLITVAGHNASTASYWAAGGGGGGFVYIRITTEDPSDAFLGNIDANGGNAATVESSSYCGGGGGGGGGVVEIESEPGILTPNSYTNTYGSISVLGGSNSVQGGPTACSNGDNGNDGTIAITNAPPVPPPSGCSGPGKAYSQTSGRCVFVNSTTITTPFNNALGGNLEPVKSYTSASPTTANQLTYEQQNAQWLLTCPVAPDSLNTLEYFNTSPGFVAGNTCLAPTPSLNTKIVVNTTVVWSKNSIANSTTNVSIENPGVLTVSNLGYSGAIELPNSTYAISNNYNTESYIFKNPPSDNESGIWTWSFEFVNFSKLTSSQVAKLSQKSRSFPKAGSSFADLEYYNSSSPIKCTYYYNYSESVDFKGISNNKIPVPVNLPHKLLVRIKFRNGTESQTNNTARAGTGCSTWLFYYGGILGGNGCSFSVTEVTNDAYFIYNNKPQIGGNGVYGFYSYGESYVYTTNDPKYANDYLVATANYEYYSPNCPVYDYFIGCYVTSAYAIPASQLHFKNVSALPYLLYNFSTPATTSDVNGRVRYLNESYDLYSPHNYLNPNSLDPFGLHVGEAMFASIHNKTGSKTNSYFVEFPYSSASTQSNTVFSNPDPKFITALNSSQQEASTNSTNPLASLLKSPIGLFKSGNIMSPSFAISTPNDYIYIINHTTSSSLLSTSTISHLFTLRMVPYGYYNLTNLQPNFASNTISSNSIYKNDTAWTKAWESYWTDALAEQGQNYYITNLTTITDSNSYVCWSWTFHCVGGSDATFNAFIPTYVTSDYAGDVFLAGINAHNDNLELAAYFSNYSKQSPTHHSTISRTINSSGISSDYGFKIPNDLATTAGGQYLYVSNQSYPNIPVFSSNSLTYFGNLSLSYANFTYNLNISSYLAHGGPFNNSKIANAYKGVGNTIDVASNHHPIAIFDYNNLLYVVDEWSFTVNSINGNYLPSSILMLRVFSSNGTEIPIDSANYDNLVLNASQSGSVDLSGANISTTISNPPYGWPLSANISISSSNTISYCAANCTYSPLSSSVKYNGYLPIGPFITASGDNFPTQNNIGFYDDYNGTVYMISHSVVPYSYCSVHESSTYQCIEYSQGYHNTSTEFLRFKPLLENYTKIAFGAYSPYDCLINFTDKASPCVYNNYISEMYPPLTITPSPIKFVTGEGSASDYYDAASLSSSLFPGGLSSYTSNDFSSSQNNISKSGYETYNGLNDYSISTGLKNSAAFIKLTSTVGGYALIPYNVSYTVTKSWDLISKSSSSCPNVLPTSKTFVYDGVSALQVNATPSSSNALVEGGSTYLQDQLSSSFYNANLTDNNSILSPTLAGYNIFTNRLLGAITINRSANSKQLLSPPQIINYTRLYNYTLYTVEQKTGNGAYYDGYSYSKLALANTSTSPPSNIPIYGVANSLIPNPNSFAGNNTLNYQNSSKPSATNIFQEFTYFKYYNTLSLSFPNDGHIIGYNRLVYKLQDAFNNTLYAPVDVDIANITLITLNVNPVVSAINANQTLLNITGTAGFVSGVYTKSFTPLPANSKIYLYYDTPIQYYNSTVSPSVSSEATSYYKYALGCAFGSNPGSNCVLANPLSKYIQGTAGATEANKISYNPQFNSTGVCPQPPKKSLLNITVPIDCSIYNSTAVIPANTPVGSIPSAPYARFCEPEFLNGSGVLTSQLGLASIVSTNSTGGFSSNTITACGSGTAKVVAQYYGGPGPEPTKYSQPAISNSISLLSPSQPDITTYEYNYSFAPNSTSASFNVGSYYLSLGDISIVFTIIIITALLLYQISSMRKPKHNHA